VSAGLWTQTDMLTKPRRVKLLRDTGTADWTTVPSLWCQLEDALSCGMEGSKAATRGSVHRVPLNIDAYELATDIRDITWDALAGHDVKPRATVPASVRALASAVVAAVDDDLTGWWAYRIGSWCRQITNVLRLNDEPQPRGIRGAACPTCQATHVTALRDGERVREPALRIDFTDGMVRAAYCQACLSAWFRGDALVDLADLINATRRVQSVNAIEAVE